LRPILFLSVFFSLILVLHGYIGVRLLSDLPIGFNGHLTGIILLIISSSLIPLGMLARFIKRQPLSDVLAWVGLLAMGLFSSLLVLTFLRDVVLMLMSLFSKVLPSHWIAAFLVWSAASVPVLALIVTLVGFINARARASVVHIDVPIAELPDGLHGFTIVQISDIHVGPTIKRNYLQAIIEKVNSLNADLIAITGDMVDGNVETLAQHTSGLAGLRARHGSYFVTGNHEYYSGAHAWITEFRRLGLQVLINEHVVLKHDNAEILIAGVTDYSAHQFDPAHRSDPIAALHGAPDSASTRVLLAHQPRSAVLASSAGFDLQLSGHTHGGQFWPWNLFVPLQQPFTAGLNRLENLWVYTSRGTGYWGPPKRFGAPSEITKIRLVPAL
jgi:predicted MPP superfamily phosphohydrolase